MSGLMSVKFESHFSPIKMEKPTQRDFDLFSMRLESITGVQKALTIGHLNKSELELVDFQLQSLEANCGTSVRMESSNNPQTNLKIRCENIISSIWNGIKKMIEWLCDKIGSLFASSKSSTTVLDSNDKKKIEEEPKKENDNENTPSVKKSSKFPFIYGSNESSVLMKRVDNSIKSLENLYDFVDNFLYTVSTAGKDVRNWTESDLENEIKNIKTKIEKFNIDEVNKDFTFTSEHVAAFYIKHGVIEEIYFSDDVFKVRTVNNRTPEEDSSLGHEQPILFEHILRRKFATGNEIYSKLSSRLLNIGDNLKNTYSTDINFLEENTERLKLTVGSCNIKLKKIHLSLINVVIQIAKKHGAVQEQIIKHIREN